MKVAFLLLIVGIVLLGLLMNRHYMKRIFQGLSIYWFRFAFSFFMLFLLNVLLGYVGIFVPINLALALTLTVFGVPGFFAVIGLSIFL